VTRFDDYPEDMGDPLALDDVTAEALLTGRPAASAARLDVAAVAAFIAEMRECRTLPAPPPSPALASLFAGGASMEDAPVAAPVPAPAPGRGRSRPALTGWRHRLAAAGVALGAALTGVVGATAADLLPHAVERVVEAMVEALTPLDIPDEADGDKGPGVTDKDGPVGEVPGGKGDGAPGSDGGGGSPTGPTGTSPAPAGGAPAGPSPARPGSPGAPPGAPGSGGVAVPGLPPPPAPGVPSAPPAPTTVPPAPSVTPPTVPGGTPTVPPAPPTPQVDPSDRMPSPR
jgi:hypothetical protein